MPRKTFLRTLRHDQTGSAAAGLGFAFFGTVLMASLVLTGSAALKTASLSNSDQSMSRAISQRFDEYKAASATGEANPTQAESCYSNLETCVAISGVTKTSANTVVALKATWRLGQRTLDERKAVDIAAGVRITGYGTDEMAIWGALNASTRGSNLSTLAGSGMSGAANAIGNAATFNTPAGSAVDARGNVYVADTSNNQIRIVTPAGATTTLAGSSVAGFADGTGPAAAFTAPFGVAVDASNTVYVADSGNNRIRKVTADGAVTTIAGYSGPGRFADGTGGAAKFNLPTGVAVSAAGTIFVADSGNNRIRAITATGVVTTFAGSGAAGSTDGTGTAATFNNPRGIAIDISGNLYVASFTGNVIRKITAAGVVTTLAGSGAAGTLNGQGTAATFNRPSGIAVDRYGNVFVSEGAGASVRMITPTGAVTSYTAWAAGAGGAVTLTKPNYGDVAPVQLDAAEPFSVLAGTSVTNSGATTLNGRLGVSPGTTVDGQATMTFAGAVNSEDSAIARADLQTAMADARARTSATPISSSATDHNLIAGVYSATDFTNSTTITLDGRNDPRSVFIFQITGDFAMSPSSNVRLLNGAQPSNVFWVVTGTTSLGAGSTFAGQVLSTGAVAVGLGAKVDGRVLSLSTVSLDRNTFTGTAPVIATISYTVVGGSGLAADAGGSVYSADSSNHKIWKIQ